MKGEGFGDLVTHMTSGRQRIDTREVVPNQNYESHSGILPLWQRPRNEAIKEN